MNLSQKRSYHSVNGPPSEMYEPPQSKKSRKSRIHLDELGPADRAVLERAAALLNKPVLELVEESSNRDSLAPGSTRNNSRTTEAEQPDFSSWAGPNSHQGRLNENWQYGYNGFETTRHTPSGPTRQPLQYPNSTRPEPHLNVSLSLHNGDHSHSQLDRYDSGFDSSFHGSELEHTGSWLQDGNVGEVFAWSGIQNEFHPADLGHGNFTPIGQTPQQNPYGRENANPTLHTRQIQTSDQVLQGVAENLVTIDQSANEFDFVFSDDPPDSDDSGQNANSEQWEKIGPSKARDSETRLASSAGSNSDWSLFEVSPPHNSFERPSFPEKAKLIRWVSGDQDTKEPSYRPQRRGPFQDHELRKETGNTRKLKACVRCRMQKIRCQTDSNDPKGICKTCQGVSNQKIHTLPCNRYKITEVTLFRTGKAPGMEFTFRWPVMKLRDISNWADNDTRTISIKSDVCPIPIEFQVRKFVPIPQDSLHKGWMDGKIKKWKEVTPFAIVNMSAAVKDMQTHINTHVFECMEFFLQGKDAIVRDTYAFARKYMLTAPEEEAHLLGNFFRLWFAIRRTATVEHIVGEDTIDMEPEMDRSYPLFGKIPLPPVMIQQLDMILTLGLLNPLRKKVLEDLQRIVVANKPKSWMTIYLITFIFLHSCAALSAENYYSARKHGLRRRYAMPNFISDLHHGVNVFLSYYHYCTKPCDPFRLDWKRRQLTPFSEMTTDEIHFLIQTTEMVKERKDKIRVTSQIGLYEDDLYFVSQMFEENWMPKDTTIDYDDGTVADVPLQRYYTAKQK